MMYGEGISKEGEALALGEKFGIVEKSSGGAYSYGRSKNGPRLRRRPHLPVPRYRALAKYPRDVFVLLARNRSPDKGALFVLRQCFTSLLANKSFLFQLLPTLLRGLLFFQLRLLESLAQFCTLSLRFGSATRPLGISVRG
jgi:hypothetical protein